MPESVYYSAVETVPVNKSRTPLQFLVPPEQHATEAWVLAGSSWGGSGSIKVRLVNEYNSPLSDYTEIFGSEVTKVKMQHVNIVNTDPVPRQVKLEVTNNSISGADAKVYGVLVTYA